MRGGGSGRLPLSSWGRRRRCPGLSVSARRPQIALRRGRVRLKLSAQNEAGIAWLEIKAIPLTGFTLLIK